MKKDTTSTILRLFTFYFPAIDTENCNIENNKKIMFKTRQKVFWHSLVGSLKITALVCHPFYSQNFFTTSGHGINQFLYQLCWRFPPSFNQQTFNSPTLQHQRSVHFFPTSPHRCSIAGVSNLFHEGPVWVQVFTPIKQEPHLITPV